MKVIEVEAVALVNPYTEDIKQLIKASEKNPKAAGQFDVPVADEGKAKFKISKAANELDRTASLVSDEISKDGKTVVLVYRIKERHKSGPRKRRSGNTSETTAE